MGNRRGPIQMIMASVEPDAKGTMEIFIEIQRRRRAREYYPATPASLKRAQRAQHKLLEANDDAR